jgi:hypothetical protein
MLCLVFDDVVSGRDVVVPVPDVVHALIQAVPCRTMYGFVGL